MKKLMFYTLLLTILFVGINVKAKYSSYETGDVIMINNHYFVVIEDSDSNTEKLKLMDMDNIYISNYEEVVDICGSPYIAFTEMNYRGNIPDREEPDLTNYIQCVTQHANLCTDEDDDCETLELPFETRMLEEDEELVYDENSPTNIGYFMKNKLDNYYKDLLGYNNVKTRLITADEQISYFVKKNIMAGGNLMVEYGRYSTYGCAITKVGAKSSKETVVDNIKYTLDGFYLVNSLKYTSECNSLVYYTDSYGYVSTNFYREPFDIRPVIEVSKKEFSYEITKETEGEGSLEVQSSSNYKLGDFVIINKKPYIVVNNKNGQLRLMSAMPVGFSNDDELYDICYGDDYDWDGTTDEFACLIEHVKYCSLYEDNDDCDPLYAPFNYNNVRNHTYNPNVETNIGHYIKNELKDVIQEEFGETYNIIDVDVLTYDEMINLSETGIAPIIIPIPGDYPEELAKAPSNSKMLEQRPSLELILNYNDSLDELDDYIEDYGLIFPVITLSIDDLPVNARAGSNVTIVTEPEEGYELVELTVTDDENNKVIYTPTDLVRREKGTYTFKMTSANAHVYAKFIPTQTYNAKSLSEELTIDDGLDKLSGTSIKYRITLNAGDTLTGIVYYDEDRNEIQVPFEEENGEYTFNMPPMNVFLRAVINYANPVYNLYGTDITIPVQKSEEGGTLTFTINGTKKVDKIIYKNEEGEEIYPYYSVNNGTYSVIMPANDVYVEITYLDEVVPEPIPTPDEQHIPAPITRDNIIKSVTIFTIGLFIFMTCIVVLKKRKPRKKVLIPYDMV